jgi:hypothetical protein
MVNWLQENYENIAAIIGTIYVAARMIVALTPTPKDEIFLDKVGVWLKAIGKIVGLDLTQGVHSKENK